jgi:8-oxo-dGTP diphosphatase
MTRPSFKKDHIVTSVVAVIVNEAGEVLLTRRNIEPFKDLWVMPGGKIDLGEPVLEALQREVREEVGIEVAVEGLIDLFEHLTPGEDNYHFVILYYRCRPLSCAIVHNHDEVSEARWVPPGELPAYHLADGSRYILAKVFPQHRRRDDRQPGV